jgi:integrase
MKTKAEEFPINIQRGSSTVKIYRDVKETGTYYRVTFYMGSKRQRLNFADLETAKLEAEAKAAHLSRGDMDAIQVSGKDRLIYGRALEAIRPFGVALDAAAQEYADARKVLGDFSLAEAAKFYMRHHGRGICPKPVAEAVAEMIAAKTEKGVSAAYLADLRYRLGAFAGGFRCNVNAILPDDIRSFLEGMRLAPRGFNNMLTTIGTFFAFARDRGWLSREAELLAGIEKRREKAVPVEIFTPAEMGALLSHCSKELKPCLALAAFAGLRAEEILRLDWADLERRPGFIEVSADKAKTAARRLVPIAANLAHWLAISSHRSGRVWPHSKPWFFESIRDTVKRINTERAKRKPKEPAFAWKANALRHSFISYRVAEIQDVNRVALEAGNSPKMIFQHYRELCTPTEARTWFALAPVDAENVIPLEAAR